MKGRILKSVFLGVLGFFNRNYYQPDFSETAFYGNLSNVGVGEITYVERPIKSLGFFVCTGVILDYDGKAVFAHALPAYEFIEETKKVNGFNVVNELVRVSNEKGLDPKAGEAIVIAGKKTELERILADLKNENIFVREQRLYSGSYDVYFDPLSDYLRVFNKTP